MTDLTTDPPPSPTARALRAIDRNLDALGRFASQTAAGVAELAELGAADARALRAIESNTAEILALLKLSVLPRLDDLERWRGEHERDHVRQ